MEFVFTHTPIAQKRARIGKHGNFYNPQKREIIQCRMDALSQIVSEGRLIDSGPCISLNATFYTPYPKKLDCESIKRYFLNPDFQRPDLDNYLKFYMDALQGIAYEDDMEVTQIVAEKIFSHSPRVHIKTSPHIGSYICQMEHFEKQNVIMHERLCYIHDLAIKKLFSSNEKQDWALVRQWAYEGILDEIIQQPQEKK